MYIYVCMYIYVYILMRDTLFLSLYFFSRNYSAYR